MNLPKYLVSFSLFCYLMINSADSKCQESFDCGKLGSPKFPLSGDPGSGWFMVDGCDSENPKILLEAGGVWHDILNKTLINNFFNRYPVRLNKKFCFFPAVSLPKLPSGSLKVSHNLTLLRCSNEPSGNGSHDYVKKYRQMDCSPVTFYYIYTTIGVPAPREISSPPQYCSVLHVLMKSNQVHDLSDSFDLLTAEHSRKWNVSKDCFECHFGGGQCPSNATNESCSKRAISGGGVLILLVCLSISYIIWLHKKRINGGYLHSRDVYSGPSSTSDIEGKLWDGREVAIKRLYEQNCRRVEQFINEIMILTGLRHPNLVSLYGCTSRRSRELLLVYEYIANGTVADHLHGERAKEALLTWPVRMSIAIETATALAYLHKSDIIHRDVKTSKILLDNNFCVKVADFGLSRLFPSDVTHISTTPRGTPGYIDPDYHHCYQVTDKSDVYSFGVVLVELISSMPAVDISRHSHEINLANLAVNRIQRGAFDELIDPSLGYESDAEITRMTTLVAEIAFRCLQLEKDMRPSMDEVLVFLKDV